MCAMRLPFVLRFIFVLMILDQVAHSQAVDAALVGTITDSSGAAVPNAKVTVAGLSTKVSGSSLTNEPGNSNGAPI